MLIRILILIIIRIPEPRCGLRPWGLPCGRGRLRGAHWGEPAAPWSAWVWASCLACADLLREGGKDRPHTAVGVDPGTPPEEVTQHLR